MFDVPGSDIVDVVIDGNVVKGEKTPQYIRRPTELTYPPKKELNELKPEPKETMSAAGSS